MRNHEAISVREFGSFALYGRRFVWKLLSLLWFSFSPLLAQASMDVGSELDPLSCVGALAQTLGHSGRVRLTKSPFLEGRGIAVYRDLQNQAPFEVRLLALDRLTHSEVQQLTKELERMHQGLRIRLARYSSVRKAYALPGDVKNHERDMRFENDIALAQLKVERKSGRARADFVIGSMALIALSGVAVSCFIEQKLGFASGVLLGAAGGFTYFGFSDWRTVSRARDQAKAELEAVKLGRTSPSESPETSGPLLRAYLKNWKLENPAHAGLPVVLIGTSEELAKVHGVLEGLGFRRDLSSRELELQLRVYELTEAAGAIHNSPGNAGSANPNAERKAQEDLARSLAQIEDLQRQLNELEKKPENQVQAAEDAVDDAKVKAEKLKTAVQAALLAYETLHKRYQDFVSGVGLGHSYTINALREQDAAATKLGNLRGELAEAQVYLDRAIQRLNDLKQLP